MLRLAGSGSAGIPLKVPQLAAGEEVNIVQISSTAKDSALLPRSDCVRFAGHFCLQLLLVPVRVWCLSCQVDQVLCSWQDSEACNMLLALSNTGLIVSLGDAHLVRVCAKCRAFRPTVGSAGTELSRQFEQEKQQR